MDIKIEGLDLQIMKEALAQAQAKAGCTSSARWTRRSPAPRADLSPYAPRIVTMQINPEKIGDLIGPKGKTIRGIQDETGAELTVDDSGLVTIAAVGGEAMERARQMVQAITAEPVDRRDVRGHGEDARRRSARSSRSCRAPKASCTSRRCKHGRTEKTEDVVKKGDRVKVKLHRSRRARTSAPVDEGARAEARKAMPEAGAGVAAARRRRRRRRASARREDGDDGGRRSASGRPRRPRRALAPRSGGGRGASERIATADAALRRTVLPNGLTVLSEHMPGVRSVAFGAWVRAASLHEPRERMGVSHLLEHMVFKGTRAPLGEARSRSRSRRSAARSTRTRRASTRRIRRACSTSISTMAADVIGDFVFRPAASRQPISTLERKVVLEEIGMVDDTPDDLVFELHNEALWGAHPYGYSILGTRDTVSLAQRRATCAALHERAYHPGAARRRRVGQRRARRSCSTTLERTGWTDVPARRRAAARSYRRRRRSRRARVTSSATARRRTSCSARRPCRTAIRGATRMSLLSMLLGGGMSSRLFQRVREELGLAYSVYTFQSFHADAGMHGVYVGTAPETAREALDAIRDGACDRSPSTGLPDDELAMGKSQLKGQITLSLESVSSRMYRARGGGAVRRAVPHARRAARARSTRSTAETVRRGLRASSSRRSDRRW